MKDNLRPSETRNTRKRNLRNREMDLEVNRWFQNRLDHSRRQVPKRLNPEKLELQKRDPILEELKLRHDKEFNLVL